MIALDILTCIPFPGRLVKFIVTLSVTMVKQCSEWTARIIERPGGGLCESDNAAVRGSKSCTKETP